MKILGRVINENKKKDIEKIFRNTPFAINLHDKLLYEILYRDEVIALVEKKEVADYLKCKEDITREYETHIYQPGYYEHLIQYENNRPILRPSVEEKPLRLMSKDESYIEIGKPSCKFLLYIFDNTEEFSVDLRRRLMMGILSPRNRGSEVNHITDVFRIRTMKLFDVSERHRPKLYHQLIEAAAFHFAYGYGIAISFPKTWARITPWFKRKSFEEDLQFPVKTYNSDLVSYYNLSLSTDSLVMSYLALYKIVEYFYPLANEKKLHAKIKLKLTAPDFSHNQKRNIRELVKLIKGAEKSNNELASLKEVLEQFFDIDELHDWIVEYENEQDKYFTVPVSVFNTSVKVDLNDNMIISSISSRIYTFRNALVHNKEDSVERYIPFSEHDEIIKKEIHLIKYIAEQLILRDGEFLH